MKQESGVRAAAVQMAPSLGDLAGNRCAVLDWLQQAAGQGAQLIVFPECVLSGYIFDSLEEARQAAEPIPGPASAALAEACADLGVYSAVGLLEASGDAVFNTVLISGPDGVIGIYRKTHLPLLGADRFLRRGDELAVMKTSIGTLGPLICYDLRFPEPPRVLALMGAEILIHPTNWPHTSVDFPEFVTKAVARSNRVFLISCDRVGEERGTRFLGRSQILAPSGRPLAAADDHSTMIIAADLDLTEVREKRWVHIPGEIEMNLFADRRPELYRRLVE